MFPATDKGIRECVTERPKLDTQPALIKTQEPSFAGLWTEIPRLTNEFVPGLAAQGDDIGLGSENAVG